jgi:hypothetical protein
MKNPILVVLAILAVICSGLLYAAPTLRGLNKEQVVVDNVPQVKVQQTNVQPPAVVGESQPQLQIQPRVVVPQERHRIFPIFKRQQPMGQQPMGQQPMGQQPMGQTQYCPIGGCTLWVPTSDVFVGPNLFHPFSAVEKIKYSPCYFEPVICLNSY